MKASPRLKRKLHLMRTGRDKTRSFRALMERIIPDRAAGLTNESVWIDGHSFKAYTAHPTTGAHFHPEVCGVICPTTKALVGWSAGSPRAVTSTRKAISLAMVEQGIAKRAARRAANLERKLEAALPGTTVYVPKDRENGSGGETVYIRKP